MRDGLLIIAFVLLMLAPSIPGSAGAAPDRNRERAEDAYAAMQRAFWLPEQRLYRQDLDASDNLYAYHWPFSQALAATIDMAALSGNAYRQQLDQLLPGLDTYWDPTQTPPAYDSYVRPPLGQGGDVYYDDNLWTALELMRVYRLNGSQAALQRAQQVWQLAQSGWDRDPTHAAPGGIFWTQAPNSYGRVVASNAPAAQLGLQLAAVTGAAADRDWAVGIAGWVETYLRGPDELYWDSIALDGAVNTTVWSYNQGTMIGANVLLYRQTGDAAYLERARRTAARALAQFEANQFAGQPPEFNTIFWKNLLLLDASAPDSGYREAMQRYADRLWERSRDPQTGLFRVSPGRAPSLLEQAAMVQIYAVLAGSAETERTFVPLVGR